ncbi:MAG TPA: glycosyltransferase family 2 protein [Firmicutes bacterium]|nr:glycosyltransferase family 2 protein [Bacillota bacterium]
MKLCALIPAFNEQARIAATVGALLEVCQQVLVVDDGSADDTAILAQSAGAQVISLPVNRGKGAAIRAGLPHLTGDVVLLVDGDLGRAAARLVPLADAVKSDIADLTIARFDRTGAGGGLGIVRGLARWAVQTQLGIPITEPLSGQRAVRRELLASLPLAEGFGVEVGMIFDAIKCGGRVLEVDLGRPPDGIVTGKTLAGYYHRLRQLLDVLVALRDRWQWFGRRKGGKKRFV